MMIHDIQEKRCVIAAIALGMDAGLGDPQNRWHPVAWMGTAIGRVKLYAPQVILFRLGFGAAVSLGGAGGVYAIGGRCCSYR